MYEVRRKAAGMAASGVTGGVSALQVSWGGWDVRGATEGGRDGGVGSYGQCQRAAGKLRW